MFTGPLSYEASLDPFDGGLAADLADRVGEGNVLGPRLDAVLGVAAGGDTAGTHEGVETLVRVQLARRMEVHEERLRDGGRAHEARARWVVAVDLRAHLETASARDTAIQRIAELLHFCREPGARPEVVGPVEWNPGAQILEGLEHAAAVDDEVADDGELRKWLADDPLVELGDERRAPHSDPAIHD